MDSYFHNPYNFIPAPRPEFPPGVGLGQGRPASHDRYHSERWSGRIRVRLTAKAPLMLPESSAVENVSGDKSRPHYAARMARDPRFLEPRPYLAPTGLKGALRSDYEAITNSRLGVFGLKGRISRRFRAQEAVRLVPARISDCGTLLELYVGNHSIGSGEAKHSEIQKLLPYYSDYRYCVPKNEMYAASILYYSSRVSDELRSCVSKFAKDGTEIHAVLRKYRKFHWREKHILSYEYWRVIQFKSLSKGEAAKDWCKLPKFGWPKGEVGRGFHQPQSDPEIEVTGYFCVTNKNARRKHDERLFFTSGQKISLPLDDFPGGKSRINDLWKDVIRDYRHVAKTNSLPAGVSPSRHVVGDSTPESLEPGTLLYVSFKDSADSSAGAALEVDGCYPVQIGRQLSETSAEDLLPDTLRPANSIETLSAADRVFGWTADEAEQNDAPIAHRGQLRIADVVCVQGGFLDFGKAGLALKSLGAPQRQQARFYAALDQSGRPVEDGKPLADVFYNKGQGIRGRKVFLTQRDRPTDLDGWRRALRNCVDGQEARSKTNRTVRDLVEEGAVFEAEIEVTNLNDEELGALLWLLDLAHQEPQMDGEPLLKLGGGKPLGLGCVSVELRALALSRGTAIAERYRAIAAPEQAAEVLFEMKRGSPRKDASDLPVCASDCIESFKKQVGDCHGSGAFLDAPFVKAFLQAARGVHGDVVYPEILGDPDANGYAWFVENEKGPRLALPGLADGVPNGLPRLPAQD